MFEGLVHRVLVGYLGRYFKNIQKEQLKLSLWNEEVLLENVDLIPEAFDYLRLPFSIKQGRVGRLSIKLSWKKIGWDHPIIIAVEDVFICLSQRDDQEWNLDAVERREFAAKKAQLAAAELSKLSKRICGELFVLHFQALVLDSIQLSIRNFHVQYSERQFDSAQVLFGLQFSNLTVKQNLVGKVLNSDNVVFAMEWKKQVEVLRSFGGKVVGGQVNKTVNIEGLEIYCSTSKGDIDSMSLDDVLDSKFRLNARHGGYQFDYLLQPLNVSVSLGVNRAGKLDSDLPQYSIRADLNYLAMSLNEIQLQQILILSDYLSTSSLREKYGRYRPWGCPLSRKQDGWQRLWWHYAQESILADVRLKLKKTSWRYLGQRLNSKELELFCSELLGSIFLGVIKFHVNLFSAAIDEYIIRELEQMEKESDIDDILSYRSVAERKLQEVLSNSLSSNMEVNGTHSFIEKSQNDERSSSRSRGWLNWISRGMLGAGGTDDSIQFSGVVSDEVVKDIYEATEFQPSFLSGGDVDANYKMFTCAMKFSVGRITATLQSKRSSENIADLIFNEFVIECKLCEELATIICHFRHFKLVLIMLPFGLLVLYLGKKLPLKSLMEENVQEDELPSCRLQVDLSPKRDVELSIKVIVQPLEVTCDVEFFLSLSELFTVLKSFEFQLERVLLSLNGIEDVRTRLLSKVEILDFGAYIKNHPSKNFDIYGTVIYILSSHKRLSWDVSVINIVINVPWRKAMPQEYNLVLKLESLSYTSKFDVDSIASVIEDQYSIPKQFSSVSASNSLTGFQVKDLYNYYEVKLNDIELSLITLQHAQAISILEKFCASVTLASCIISDQSVLKQLENFLKNGSHWPKSFEMNLKRGLAIYGTMSRGMVYVNLSALNASFSPLVYEAVVAFISHIENLCSRSEPVMLRNPNSLDVIANQPGTSGFGFGFSVSTRLDLVSFCFDLANDGENSSQFVFSLQGLDIWFSHTQFDECWVCTKALKIVTSPLRGENDGHILCSSGKQLSSSSANHEDLGIRHGSQDENYEHSCTDVCFLLHYEAYRTADTAVKKCTVGLNDIDFHCYPYIVGLLVGFYNKISAYGSPFASDNSFSLATDAKSPKGMTGFEFGRFGYSNFIETGSSDHASISLDYYPFVTLCNSGSLGSLESSLRYPIADWRKLFDLRDGKIRSTKFCLKNGSKTFNASPLTFASGVDTFSASGSICDANLLNVDINLCGVRVHFHDSSCIVGTVMVPTLKSSLSIYEDSMDLLCSAEGLFLTSSWWTKNFQEFLWGPLLPNLSPILNLRVRKGNFGSLPSELEVSIGIQHVYCMLPPEYLAIIIGYFSLPDWSSNLSEQPFTEKHERINTEKESLVVYKFEILDSTLILPVEHDDHQFLKIEIQQLYCSFIDKCAPNDAVMSIPPEYLVSAHKVAKENHCLNMFGRDLSLSFLLRREDEYGCLVLDQDTGCCKITLISPLSADLWVWLPCENESCSESSSVSTCIISTITDCQFIADDCYSLDGLEALLDVVDQFSSVDDQSKNFDSDVLHFLRWKRSQKESFAVSPAASGIESLEVRCSVDSLLIKLCHSREGSTLPEPIAKIDVKFKCSASLVNETIMVLDFGFSSLGLYSLPSSVMLARCNGSSSGSLALHFCFLKSVEGENELNISLPSLSIWLHLFDWTGIIGLCNFYAKRMAESELVQLPSMSSSQDLVDPTETVIHDVSRNSPQNISMPTSYVPKYAEQDSISLLVRSENIGLTVHFPFCATETKPAEIQAAIVQERKPQDVTSNTIEGKNDKFITFTTHSRSTIELLVGKIVTLKYSLQKACGTVGTGEDESITTWPLFETSQVVVSMEISNSQLEFVDFNWGLQCDRLDVQLSHQVLCFWHGVRLDIPEAGASRSSFVHMDFKIQLRKISFLVSDERWSFGGPLLEIALRNFLLHANVTENSMESSVASNLEVNYNNIHKVLWEPFVEPWKFQINMIRKHEMTAHLNSSIMTDIDLTSTMQLNLNCTESLIETNFPLNMTLEMVNDAWHVLGPTDPFENQRSLSSQFSDNIREGSYAPYVLQNLTSLPLGYHVFKGLVNADEFDFSEMKDAKSVQPGSSVPIYLNETPEEQLFRYGPAQSSDRLSEKQSNGVVHHFMSIQLDGMFLPSPPISMDLVGLTYFEVDFTKVSKRTEVEKTGNVSKYDMDLEENARFNTDSGFVVPVVFDVSVQRYTKLIRLYSTVILANTTSVPLELRFDIPFGVSPKILDPIYPDQELPLPLHLAETGRMRWRPHGNSYLWSEVHDISSILSHESKIGFLRSFVCYPSHPSSDPFRCCISVQSFSLPSSRKLKKGSYNTLKQLVESCNGDQKKSNNRFIHQVTLSAPLLVINYLPDEVSLAIENGGVTRTVLLSEVETSFHHIDPSHDLGLEFCIHGFRPLTLKFPRAETFGAMAKFNGTKLSLTETVSINSDSSNGLLCVTVEKLMDAFSGARELFIYVPFLLYNCTGFPLNISDCNSEMKGSHFTVPSCYVLVEDELIQGKKDGLSYLSSDQDLLSRATQIVSSGSSSLKNHIAIPRRDATLHLGTCVSKPQILSGSSGPFQERSDKHDLVCQKASLDKCSNTYSIDTRHGEVKACMYSPHGVSSVNEIMVRVSRHEYVMENFSNSSWSTPFLLVPPSGSSTVLVPQSSSNSALIISVTASDVAGSFAGRTQAIAFQPRELLISICFDEPGWEWSGSFLPDHLGDTQVKMRNNAGVLRMIRVEVQNANVSNKDEKIIGSLHGNSGTNLILLSEDDTGFMPYRIDNFSKERLRVYQQKCENFDTIIQPYTSCPYAWDEPCFPHRLTIELPGERLIGSYALDDLKEYIPVQLKATAEKPERTLLLSVHAEGAIKVLGIVDSSFHVLNDFKDPPPQWFREKTKHEQKQKDVFYYKEKFSVAIPYIGISLINSYPQELLFACAKNISLNLLQSLDQQKISFQISSLQIDNQLHTTPYPVILSFNQEYRSSKAGQRVKDDSVKSKSDIVSQRSREPILSLAVATWRKKDISLVSFEVANFRLELEQEVILRLLDYCKAVSSRFQSNVLPFSDPKHPPLLCDAGFIHAQTREHFKTNDSQLLAINLSALSKSQTSSAALTSVVPIGAPWQHISFLDRRQKKIYVELFDLAPIKFTLSFSSAPWMLRNGVLTSGESLIHRGLMALADVEGARIHLKQLRIEHQMASWESMQDILIRHYTRQLLHEMYKVFGSAGVIGNPMGFARSLGLGIRDFLSVPARSFLQLLLQSPTGLITGMAQGTTSLVSNTVYALSDAATQFSKAAQKGIVAFTFDDQSVARMEKQQKGVASHSKGVINEVLEGLTGLLQSPIKEAEKHGLPGVLSGIALGVAGLVARPAASILEVTGKTAQSIRNRSRLYQMGPQRYRVRLPRPLSRELPLRPYSLEEAVGASVLMEADDGLNLKNEVLAMCKSLKQAGKFVVVTERLLLIVSSSSLVDLTKPEFRGVPIDPEWLVESEISLDGVIHADAVEEVVHIVGTGSDALLKQNQHQSRKGVLARTKSWNNPTSLPLSLTNLELASMNDAKELLQILLSIIEQGKERRLGSGHVLHRTVAMIDTVDSSGGRCGRGDNDALVVGEGMNIRA
ncbi:unnamed protein product [Dovyalis caffra]|uniref:Uncharacterized protein n=1 Tax=Dovyalis caffra TaxID=77055 RepID=A0AAV1SWT5_9ROSI|nr:unnamed protein product [Dovyalis caffra]